MTDILMAILLVLLILGLIYYIYKRGQTTNTHRPIINPTGSQTSNVTHEDVVNIIRRDFPAEQHAEVLEAVNECKNYGEHRDTIQSIILGFAKGNVEKVREYVKIAERVPDYRDLASALLSKQPKIKS